MEIWIKLNLVSMINGQLMCNCAITNFADGWTLIKITLFVPWMQQGNAEIVFHNQKFQSTRTESTTHEGSDNISHIFIYSTFVSQETENKRTRDCCSFQIVQADRAIWYVITKHHRHVWYSSPFIIIIIILLKCSSNENTTRSRYNEKIGTCQNDLAITPVT